MSSRKKPKQPSLDAMLRRLARLVESHGPSPDDGQHSITITLDFSPSGNRGDVVWNPNSDLVWKLMARFDDDSGDGYRCAAHKSPRIALKRLLHRVETGEVNYP